LVRNWISTRHASEELEIKRLNADNTGSEQTLRIEGGLPDLPGTDIIMPPRPDGPQGFCHADDGADPFDG